MDTTSAMEPGPAVGELASVPGPSPERVYNPGMDTPAKQRTRRIKPTVPAALLKVRAVAAFLSVSVRQVWDLTNEGQMPRSLKLGGGTFWRRSELEDWIDAGMPPLPEWERIAAERKAARDR